MKDWQEFVIAYGARARADHLAAVLGRSKREIEALRARSVCATLPTPNGFAQLFALWNGRAPTDAEWPMPKRNVNGGWEWLLPESTLLASLVGRMGPAQIAKVLTERLRKLTGDPSASRSRACILNQMSAIGLQTYDVLGGITVRDAGAEIGSTAIVYRAIEAKHLKPFRVGRLWVIPHDQWSQWKAKRVLPPPGYVPLASLRKPLSFSGDKLAEMANMGYVPTAIRCNPFGGNVRSTKFGTWWIDAKVGRKLVADRRAGRPMPWFGKPNDGNLRKTWSLWKQRKHPADCQACCDIWGSAGAPSTYEDYRARYPELPHGAKRHLTRPWTPGLKVREVAGHCGCSVSTVRRAIDTGLLRATARKGVAYVTKTDATRWKARRCPVGDGRGSWVSLAVARRQYGFTSGELSQFIAEGKLFSKEGHAGATRGITYVVRQQCVQLREDLGFSVADAARHLGITVSRLEVILRELEWRQAPRIPSIVIDAARKRLESRCGSSIEEAARAVGKPVLWVREQIQNGTVRVRRAKWDRRRVYLSDPMLERLRAAAKKPTRQIRWTNEWMRLSEAATHAGVSATTMHAWGIEQTVRRRQSTTGWRYHRRSIERQAKRYWESARFRRRRLPAWLQLSTASAT